MEEVCRRWEVRSAVVGPGHRAHPTGSPGGCASSTASTARSWPTCRPAPSATTPPSTTGPWPGPGDLDARAADDPGAAAGAGRLRAPTSWPCWPIRRGSTASTTTSSSSTRWSVPGGDAAVLRLAGPGPAALGQGLALTTDSNPRGAPRPAGGHRARPWPSRRSTWPAPGPGPSAVVNCLNFGNPEHPEVMWQLSEAIDGMARRLPRPRPAGHRRQRQPLQRERRRRTSTPPRSSGCSASSTG